MSIEKIKAYIKSKGHPVSEGPSLTGTDYVTYEWVLSLDGVVGAEAAMAVNFLPSCVANMVLEVEEETEKEKESEAQTAATTPDAASEPAAPAASEETLDEVAVAVPSTGAVDSDTGDTATEKPAGEAQRVLLETPEAPAGHEEVSDE